MTKQKADLPVNMKEKNAKHTFRVTIRDQVHFYKIVKWLNENVGKGEDKWTMEGRVLRIIKQGKTVSPNIYIYVDAFDEANSLYLSLL